MAVSLGALVLAEEVERRQRDIRLCECRYVAVGLKGVDDLVCVQRCSVANGGSRQFTYRYHREREVDGIEREETAGRVVGCQPVLSSQGCCAFTQSIRSLFVHRLPLR